MGLSYLSYSEPAQPLSISELGLTLKSEARYELVSGKVDLSASGFFTVLPFLGSPSSLPETRYYGVNARTGYKMEAFAPRLRLEYWLGWYFWGMLTSGSYGVTYLGGPQALVSVSSPEAASRSWGVYVKFAPIAGDVSHLRLANRELAAGGSYELFKLMASWPLSVTLDLASVSAAASDQLNTLTLFSASLGASVRF